MVRLRRIDRQRLTVRDIIILWAIRNNPGVMGRELATKLGYKSRSNVQEGIARLLRAKFIEDRRPVQDHMTPNDLHITSAGQDFLEEVVPV